jgi:UDP-N-acetylmuramyl pentapeptide phosphotransferase/UDP-N-acetylglucosamine-1-phosphate transferase
MQYSTNFFFHFFKPEYRISFAFILAIIFNFYAIPVILRISRAKKLFDAPDEGRKKHNSLVPTLGGLGIYATIVIVSLTLINTCGMNGGGVASSLSALPPIVAGFTVIFFIGMKDDLLDISAKKKLIAEIIALFILIVIGDIRLNNMQGMFGVYQMSYYVSLLLSIFAGIVIINSFNLIDGIDGLASSIAMLGSFVFGVYFISILEWEYAVLAFTILGAVIPFFLYNAFGVTNKIFMGDTGSLILGFAMTVLVFRFNELNSLSYIKPHFVAGPSFSFAVIFIPMFDTLRVFIIRIYRGGSPFKADRRHIHHVLLDLGFSHLRSTLILVIFNIAIIAYAYFFNFLGNSTLFFSLIFIGTAMSFLAMWILRKRLPLLKKQSEDSIKAS